MPGVDVRVPGFNETETVEWLDPSKVRVLSMTIKTSSDVLGIIFLQPRRHDVVLGIQES